MVIHKIKNIKSDENELRKFGVIVGTFLGLLGGLFLWRGRDYYFYFFILSVVFLVPALISPVILKPVHKIWMTIAILLGWLMTRIILIVLFYLVVTPIGLLTKLFGKDFLDRKFNADTNSYWMPREAFEFDKKNYENQF